MKFFPNQIQLKVGEVALLSIQDTGGTSRSRSSSIASLSTVIDEDDQYVVEVSGVSSGDTVIFLSDGTDTYEVPVTVVSAASPAPATVPMVTFNPSTMGVLYQQGSYTAHFSWNSMVDPASFSATSYADWITNVSHTVTGGRIAFTVQENDGAERVGTVGMSWLDISGNSHTSILTLIQYGEDDVTEGGGVNEIPIVNLSVYSMTFSSFAQGQSSSFEVSNVTGTSAYEVSFAIRSSWITVPWNNQVSYSVRVEENTGATRNGYVDVIATDTESGKSGRATLAVYQDAWSGDAAIEWSSAYENPFVFDYSSTGGAFTLRLRNISSVTATSDSTWMSASFNGDLDNPKAVLSFSQNMGAQRWSTVTVSGTGTNGQVVSDSLQFKQEQNPNYTPSQGWIQSPGSVVFSWKGNDGTLPVETYMVDETSIVATKYHPLPYSLDWLTVEYVPAVGLRYTVQNNTSSSARTCYVYLVGTATDDVEVSAVTYVRQEAYSAPVSFPIWQDKIYTIESTDSYADYTITSDGRVLYEGRAYPMNGSVDVNVAEIMRGRIKQELSLEGSGYVWLADQGGYIDFDLNVNGEYAASYATYNDWSYVLGNPPIMSEPVRMECMAGQILPFSLTVTGTSLYVEDGGNEGNGYILPEGNTTIMHTVTEGEGDVITFRVGTMSREYKVISDCYEYYLVYRNLYSGYDTFIPKGNYKYSEDYTTSTYKRNVVNDRSGDGYVYPMRGRSTVVYQKDIKPSWEFRTDWLTDEESKRMEHLFSSNEVWLCRPGVYEYLPVSITDKSYKELTYKNNGRKKVNFVINCQLDETRLRR